MMGSLRDISIRPARRLDLDAVVKIENESFVDPWSAAFLLEELANDVLRLALIAEGPAGICGYIMAWRIADQLHVLNIATSSGVRRRGVGSALLKEAALRGWAEGLREITLEVRRSNQEARRFYRGKGLQEVGVRPEYYGDNGEDALIMTGSLDCLLDA